MDSKFKNLYASICHDLTMLSVSISDIAIITNKNVDYRCIIPNISKYEAINLLKISALENRWHIYKNFDLSFSFLRQFFFYFFCLFYIK